MGAGGVGVQLVTGDTVEGGDEVGGDALRDEVVVEGGLRVHGQGAAVGAHRDARHGLDATGQHEVVEAGADLHRTVVDGGQAGGTVTVELHTGDGVGQAGIERGGAGDVHALVTQRGDDAGEDVLDGTGIELRVPLQDLGDEAGEEVDRLDGVEGAARLALATRGTDRLVDEGLGDSRSGCVSHSGPHICAVLPPKRNLCRRSL